MSRIVCALSACVLLSISALGAGSFLNDTGEDVIGLRILFSEPVQITSFGDSLMRVDHTNDPNEVVFSGGVLPSWYLQWFQYSPQSATVVEHEWILPGSDLPLDAIAENYTYEVALAGVEESISVSRHIQRNILPFNVRYEVDNADVLSEYRLYWDVDKYVDSDGDGDAQNDRDYEGAVLELVYTENYNPTITLLVVDDDEALAATWENMARNDFLAGTEIALDGERLAEISGLTSSPGAVPSWRQVHMEQNSLEYMTEYKASVSVSNEWLTSFIPQYAGKHVYEVQFLAAQSTERLRVAGWTTEPAVGRKPVGFMMSDIWNECYEPSLSSMSDCWEFYTDAQAVDKLRYLGASGFEDIVIMNQFALDSVYPSIVMTDAASGIHHIPDHDLEMVFEEIGSGHLSWQTYYFQSENADYWTDHSRLSLDYYEEFFRQYRAVVVEKASLAEDLGLDSFTFGFQHPYLWGLCGIENRSPSDARWVRDEWISLCNAVRGVFTGRIGLGVPSRWCDIADPLGRHVEFLYENIGNFGGTADRIAWARTAEDLRSAYATYLGSVIQPLHAQYRTPVRFTFWAYSYEGAATSGWDPVFEHACYDTWRDEYAWVDRSEAILSGKAFPQYPVSFREQVKMIEAMMPVLASAPYIEGVYSEYEYWKLLSFDPFLPANVIDYHTVFTGSLQGKPGFEAYRLWASMMSPNEKLLYRKVLDLFIPNPNTSGRAITVEGALNVESAPWDDIAPCLTFASPITPGFYYEGTTDLSQAQFWGRTGHSVKTVSVGVSDEGLALSVRLHETDQVGEYRYIIGLRSGSRSFYVFLYPQTAHALISIDDNGHWREVGCTSGGLFEVSSSEIRACVPSGVFEQVVAPRTLLQWQVDFHIDYEVVGRRELFFFPGSGYAVDLTGQ